MAERASSERWELVRSTRAAGQARGYTDRHREVLGEEPWRRARLLVSELATNAVRHGAGRIELSIAATRTGVRFCVSDEGAGWPAARTPGDDGGFGLHLVEDLSDRWGQGEPGTAVWFEVDRAAAS